MSTVTNPLSGLIEGLLQGHQLATQLHRQKQEDQAFKTNQALHEQNMSMQDIMNRQMLGENARPVSAAGTIENPAGPGMASPVPGLPDEPGAPAYQRKADASRTVKYGGQQYELKTPDEQRQSKLNDTIQQNNALTNASAENQTRTAQTTRNNQLKYEGGGIPAQGLEAVGIPAGTPLLRSEFASAIQEVQKLRTGNYQKLTPGEQLVDTNPQPGAVQDGAPGGPQMPGIQTPAVNSILPGQSRPAMDSTGAAAATPQTATGPRVVASGGPQLPTDDFGKYFLPKYLLKIGKTQANASLEDMTGAQAAYEKAKKSIPNTPTELAIAAMDPTKTPEERDLAKRTLKQIQSDKVNVTVQTQNAKSEAGGLTEDDYSRAGEQYARTGVMPAMGRDSTTRAKIVHSGNQWARDNGLKPADVVTMQAAYQGDKDSLKKFQSQRDQIVSFEQTAQKNLDMFLSLAGKVVDTGSPWLNLPMRQLSEKVVGSEAMAAVNAARQVANNEVAKVTSGGSMAGVLSDSARHEVDSYNPKDATLKQALEIAKVLKQDMANRHGTMDATLSDIKGRIGGQAPAPAAGAAGGGAGKISVTAPDGSVHPFDTQAQADAFKKLAGIK